MAEKLSKVVRRRGGVLWVSVSKGGRRLRRAGGRTLDEALQVRAELLSEIGLAPSSLPAMEPAEFREGWLLLKKSVTEGFRIIE